MTKQLAKMDPVAVLATQVGIDRDELARVLAATVMPSGVTKEQALVFCAVASQHRLNPLTKEIYAFPGKGGSVQSVVSVDGWIRLARERDPECFFEFEDALNDRDELVSIACTVYSGAGKRLAMAREYMRECRRGTDTWKQWPARMLRHKALIQALRMAYGFAGIVDEDEAQRIVEVEARTVSSQPRTLDALAASIPPLEPAPAEPTEDPDARWDSEEEAP